MPLMPAIAVIGRAAAAALAGRLHEIVIGPGRAAAALPGLRLPVGPPLPATCVTNERGLILRVGFIGGRLLSGGEFLSVGGGAQGGWGAPAPQPRARSPGTPGSSAASGGGSAGRSRTIRQPGGISSPSGPGT